VYIIRVSQYLRVRLHVQASHSGRLLPYKMRCQEPLNFPLGFATGATYNISKVSGANPVQILVMDVGSYPVQLTARAATGSNGDMCPFACSQQPSLCSPTGSCSCPAAGDRPPDHSLSVRSLPSAECSPLCPPPLQLACGESSGRRNRSRSEMVTGKA
jgi:hypothetical protein